MKLWRAFLYIIARFLTGLTVILYSILVAWMTGLCFTLTSIFRGWAAAGMAVLSLIIAICLVVAVQGVGHGAILLFSEKPKVKVGP